jgi:hypothetical protein
VYTACSDQDLGVIVFCVLKPTSSESFRSTTGVCSMAVPFLGCGKFFGKARFYKHARVRVSPVTEGINFTARTSSRFASYRGHKLQIKSQHECLLREPHLSVADGLITPKAFSTSRNDSFLGWTGFQIESTRYHEFRQRIEALFPEPPQRNTLCTTFRRSGLVPAKWVRG